MHAVCGLLCLAYQVEQESQDCAFSYCITFDHKNHQTERFDLIKHSIHWLFGGRWWVDEALRTNLMFYRTQDCAASYFISLIIRFTKLSD